MNSDGIFVASTIRIDVIVSRFKVRVERFQVEACSCLSLFAGSIFNFLGEFVDLFGDNFEFLFEFEFTIAQFLHDFRFIVNLLAGVVAVNLVEGVGVGDSLLWW